ncbi:DUF1254 domain-containing protein [Glycomyces paridis]|uniref:DUF1254 domain-containing protein n=1 Tax=Glycomyces paridis TaxID=2126555 RepID=A0A4V4HP90_9ACTN|nr:DUF1254 domain-containing protein [Glycomyces paridis]THV28976.1 DUF1254 domain-containing protein [Glycomyces paridis]
MVSEEQVKLATEAYVYGFPLVFNLEQVGRYTTTGVGANPAAPFNSFSHAKTLATPADTFVTINNDTVYSMAQLDLGVGPVLLSVPDTAGRYYVLQFVDAWTNNFAYIGQRGTGTESGRYLLVPPGWDGEVLGEATVVHCPTRTVSIVGRWACAGAADLPAVHALQAATTLAPLGPAAEAQGLPAAGSGTSDALDFFDRYRAWSQAFPPADRDRGLQASFAPLGLTGTEGVDSLDGDVKAALEAGYQAGKSLLERLQHSGSSPEVNGWKMTLHAFDYNLDFFEVGAVNEDRWKITDPKVRIPERAAAALGGLWGNHGYEAAYIMTYKDADGKPLDGASTYRLTLAPPPPVEGFWSVTMYDVPNFYLVDNPIGRYSIGDRTPGIVHNADGGLTITISRTEPADPVERANWLPAPDGEFRPVMRMYIPDETVLDGTYTVQAFQRDDQSS